MIIDGESHPPLKPGQVVVKASGDKKPDLMLVTKRRLSQANAEALRRSLQEYLDSSWQRVAIIDGSELDLYQLLEGRWQKISGDPESIPMESEQALDFVCRDLEQVVDPREYLRCTRCGRKSWALSQDGTTCNMPAPDGSRCEGRMLHPV